MKIGSVNHHLLTAAGNAEYEDYGTTVQGYPYVNVGQSDYVKWIRVKFIAPYNTKVKYYLWDFGDGCTLKTINREVTHKYDLATRSEWMTESGVIPIDALGKQYEGRWTYVTLTVVSYDNRVNSATTTIPACIYETLGNTVGIILEMPEGIIELPEGIIETGREINL